VFTQRLTWTNALDHCCATIAYALAILEHVGVTGGGQAVFLLGQRAFDFFQIGFCHQFKQKLTVRLGFN